MRKLYLGIGLFALFLLLYQCVLSPIQWLHEASDVHAYTAAAKKLASGADPYVSESGSRILQYLYPPTFIQLFLPVFSSATVRGLAFWAAFQLPVFVLLGLCIYWMSKEELQTKREWVLMVAACILFAPCWRNLVEGQVSAFVVMLYFCGVLLSEKDRPISAGLLLALSVHIKILPIIALPVLLVQSRWKTAGSMGIWMVLLIPIAALWADLIGVSGNGFIAKPWV